MDNKVVKKKGSLRLKDIFENIDYIIITKNKRQLAVFEGSDVNGISKTDFQKMLGDKLGADQFNYTLKYTNNPTSTVGKIRGIVINSNKKEMPIQLDNEKLNTLERRLELLSESMTNKSGVDINALMQLKDSSYQIQIDFYKSRIEVLQQEVKELKQQLKENESDAGGSNDLLSTLLTAVLSKRNPVE